MSNKWYAYYGFKAGSARASRNMEPIQGPYYVGYEFDSMEDADRYYRKQLNKHVSNIIHTVKTISTNNALLKRLKKYKAKKALRALQIVSDILTTIPEFDEKES